MREIADQVFAHSAAADSAQLRSKLAVLNDRLTSLLRVCAQYKQLLEGALRSRGVVTSPSTPSGLNLSPASPGSRSPHRSVVVLPSTVEVNKETNHLLSFKQERMTLCLAHYSTSIISPYTCYISKYSFARVCVCGFYDFMSFIFHTNTESVFSFLWTF